MKAVTNTEKDDSIKAIFDQAADLHSAIAAHTNKHGKDLSLMALEKSIRVGVNRFSRKHGHQLWPHRTVREIKPALRMTPPTPPAAPRPPHETMTAEELQAQFNMPQLRALGKQYQVDGYTTLKKDELAEALYKAFNPQPSTSLADDEQVEEEPIFGFKIELVEGQTIKSAAITLANDEIYLSSKQAYLEYVDRWRLEGKSVFEVCVKMPDGGNMLLAFEQFEELAAKTEETQGE